LLSSLRLLSNNSSLLESLLEGTSHIESVLWVVITSTSEEVLESVNGVLELDELSWLS